MRSEVVEEFERLDDSLLVRRFAGNDPRRLFMRDTQRHRLLGAAEKAELAKAMEAGLDQALDCWPSFHILITRERIRQIKAKAMKRLEHPRRHARWGPLALRRSGWIVFEPAQIHHPLSARA